MSFKVGDRVKIPKGVEGTVRYVGKVTFSTGTHLGVELDESAGDNNGRKKGKTYFNCKRKHGVIEKTAYFTAIKSRRSSKRKSISSRSKKSGKSSKPPSNLSAITDDPEEKESGKKSKKSKKASPIPSAPKITTQTKAIQTEAPKEMLAYVESEYYCKIITRLYTEENEKLRKQRDGAISQTISLQQRTDAAEARAKQLEYEIKQQNVELDPLRVDLEFKQVEIEELNIKLEIANMEIEELNDKFEESLEQYVRTVADDDKQHAELVAMNEELQQQLTMLVKVGQELFDSKDKHINRLATESDYVDSLSARLKDLLSVEQEVLGLKTEVHQLRDKCAVLEDADRMCQTLTEYNNSLEGELTDWREWVLDVEAERTILEELHDNDDLHINELIKEKKDLNVQLFELDKENKQLTIEKHDLQKEIFELRNKMDRQDISAANQFQKYNFAPTNDSNSGNASNPTDDYAAIDAVPSNPTDTTDGDTTDEDVKREEKQPELLRNSDDQKFQAIWNENIKLESQLAELRSILMSCIDSSIEGQAHYVQYELMKQYLPSHSTEVDYRGINVLSLVHKILYKAKFARDLLERFYANPSSSLLQNPNLASNAHTLCPMILSQENYIRAIQEGLLTIASDDDETWKQKVLRFETSKFKKMLETYSELLTCIETAGKTNELNFEIDKLVEHENVLKAYVNKQFEPYSPERPRKDEYRCSKNIVLQNISETHYRFQSLSIKLNQFNAKLFDLVHTPAQTTKAIVVKESRLRPPYAGSDHESGSDGDGTGEDVEESKYDEEAAAAAAEHEENIENVLKILKIGAVEKLFRLRNDVISSTSQILKYCQPVELGYGRDKYGLNYLRDGNKTAIKWASLKACKHISFKAVQRVTLMLEKINEQVKVYQLPRKRVEIVNRIIEEEEEQNEEGLITLLERAYDIISDVRKIIGSTLHTTISNTDNMPPHSYETFQAPYWEIKSSKFRVLFEKQKENQDKIQEQENTIHENHNAVSQIEKELKSKNQTIVILTEQNIQEREKSVKLVQTEQKCNHLIDKNEKFKSEILNFTSKVSAQNEEIAAKSAAIEKYKKAISRIKEKESPLGPKQINREESKMSGGVAGDVKGARHGTLLVDNEVEYSSLLQQTIQSLRRKLSELMISKKVINCNINLKPLPFTLMREKVIQNLHNKIKSKKENKHKKKRKRVRIKKEEEKKEDDDKEEEEEEESEYEWVTDEDGEDEEVELDGDDSKMNELLMKLQREKEISEEMENNLSSLSSSLDNIISTPLIIDLTAKRKRNNDLSQQIIGRQMKLRDVGIKCQEIKNNLKNLKIKQEIDDNLNIEKDGKEKEVGHLGDILARIEIPNSSLKSLGFDQTQKVLLPTKSFHTLQNSFLW